MSGNAFVVINHRDVDRSFAHRDPSAVWVLTSSGGYCPLGKVEEVRSGIWPSPNKGKA